MQRFRPGAPPIESTCRSSARWTAPGLDDGGHHAASDSIRAEPRRAQTRRALERRRCGCARDAGWWPTEAGQYLLDVANHVLPQPEHAESSLRQMARGTRGTLRIGMECHPCYQWLLKVVAQYLPQWPGCGCGREAALSLRRHQRAAGPRDRPAAHARSGTEAQLLFEPVFDYEAGAGGPAGASWRSCGMWNPHSWPMRCSSPIRWTPTGSTSTRCS